MIKGLFKATCSAAERTNLYPGVTLAHPSLLYDSALATRLHKRTSELASVSESSLMNNENKGRKKEQRQDEGQV